jgi:putative transposase
MSRLRRYNQLGNTYFVTSVTHGRQSLLLDNEQLLLQVISIALHKHNFELSGWVILPEHVHLIARSETTDLSLFVKSFKQGFGLKYRHQNDVKAGRVWQWRFWDHIIRDQHDFNRHLDYIHFNPVKHRLVSSPLEYPHSSFAQYVDEGFYRPDWGQKDASDLDGDFGE